MMVSGVGTKHYFHQNHLYSVAAMTNSTGAVVERYRYDAYGKRTVTNAGGTPIAASTIGQQRGFTGYYLDAETGLYHARARPYSPTLGRFIGRDPIGYLAGQWSLYAYLDGNPGSGLDPFGTVDILEMIAKCIRGEYAACVALQYAIPGTEFTSALSAAPEFALVYMLSQIREALIRNDCYGDNDGTPRCQHLFWLEGRLKGDETVDPPGGVGTGGGGPGGGGPLPPIRPPPPQPPQPPQPQPPIVPPAQPPVQPPTPPAPPPPSSGGTPDACAHCCVFLRQWSDNAGGAGLADRIIKRQVAPSQPCPQPQASASSGGTGISGSATYSLIAREPHPCSR